jgi:hypothetical protein
MVSDCSAPRGPKLQLFWIATIALLIGVAFVPMLFVAIPLYLVTAVSLLRSASAFLWTAMILGAIAAIGLIALYYSWGKLEYGIVGYFILFGPFLALFAAVALTVAYAVARDRENKGTERTEG